MWSISMAAMAMSFSRSVSRLVFSRGPVWGMAAGVVSTLHTREREMAVAFVMVFPSLLTPAYREKRAAANGGVICGSLDVKFCVGRGGDVKFGGFAVKFGLADGGSCGRMGR